MTPTGRATPSLRRIRVRLLVGLVVPLVAFVVLVQALGNATGALAITDGIPLAWVVVIGVWRRRLEPVALAAVAVFAIALLVSIALGGNSLPLELRRSVFPGAVGIACLVSLALRRPLLVEASRRLAQARPEIAARRPDPDAPGVRRVLTTLTAIVGVAALADAAAQVVLALTVSTATFGIAARVASYATIGGGLAVCAVYLRVVRARRRPAP
jgi:hypothetical protein